MPPPLVRVVVVRFWTLLLVSRPRRLQHLNFSEWCHCPRCRSHRVSHVPMTLHKRPPHFPTPFTVGSAILRDLNILLQTP